MIPESEPPLVVIRVWDVGPLQLYSTAFLLSSMLGNHVAAQNVARAESL
jgi:hypothetical protein